MKRYALLLALLPGCFDPLYQSPSDAGPDAGPAQPDGGIVGSYLAPEVVLVVDRSGSMADPAQASSGQSCADGNGNYIPSDPTLNCKWNNLLRVLEGSPGSPGMLQVLDVALSATGAPARLGLITFADKEGGGACTPGVVRVPVAEHSVTAIAQALDATVPAGATPTAATMGVVPGAFPAASGHRPDRYAILLTDGAPNCNAGIDATAASCGGNRCTTACSDDWNNCACNPAVNPEGPLLCLDDDASVNAVGALNAPGVDIHTFVIGFGADTGISIAVDTLNRMAQAGGTNAQSPALTQTRYYQANTALELSGAFGSLKDQIAARCTFTLAQPAPAGATTLRVELGSLSASVPQANFALDEARTGLAIHDANLCDSLRSAAGPRFIFGR